MTDKSQPSLVGHRLDLTTGLSAQQLILVALMREHRFGRIENMQVRGGQPIFDEGIRLVCVKRLDGETANPPIAYPVQYELKKQVRTLFEELARLENGTVIRLEFRHGLPHLIEVRSAAFLKPSAT